MRIEKDITDIIFSTKKWVSNFVIRLNMCPFALHPFENDRIKYAVCNSRIVEDWVKHFINECNTLIETPKEDISTTLIIIANGLDLFDDYLDIVETFEEMIEYSGANKILQLATFHPQYQFEGTTYNDVTNYTNRSPYPIFHLLRTEEVSAAIEHYGNTKQIPIKNKKLLLEMGLEKILAFFPKTNP